MQAYFYLHSVCTIFAPHLCKIDMFTIILIMLSGMIAGYLLRRCLFGRLGRVITMLIWTLLFLLGLEVGSNERIVQGLATLGLEAVLIALAGTLGSVTAAWGLWRVTRREDEAGEVSPATDVQQSEPLFGALKGSLVIIAFFVLGVVVALTGWMAMDAGTAAHITDFSFYVLATLMACVGASIGSDPQTLKNFRALNPRLVLLPLCTILGTLVAAGAVSIVLSHRSLTDCLAVGSGFAYYSLSSIFITEYRGAELGTIALLSNISRELLTLLAAPLLVRWFGPLSPISAGGATTMDTTLPVIARTCGNKWVVVSIFHGFVVDFSVPFLVTLWCSL